MIHFQSQLKIIPNNKYNFDNKFFQKNLLQKKNVDTLEFSSNYVKKELSRKFKNTGDKYAQNSEDNKAVYYYKKSIKTNIDNPFPYYNLAKIYRKNDQLNQSIEIYKKLLEIKPDEVEAQTLIGKIYEQKGNYKKARELYKKAVKIDLKYDFAQRSLKEINNLILAQKDPVKAKILKKQTAQNNLRLALALVNQHASADLLKGIKGLQITYAETDSLSGHRNIAQYENQNKRIVISNDYVWAAPEIVAAYLIHEATHAKDRDGLSSIKEEQDAYQASIEFWIAHNHGIEDPELDYAEGLYKQNPQKLKDRVAETYRSRDKSLPDYSPHHLPLGQENFLTKLKFYFFRVKDKYNNNTIPIS